MILKLINNFKNILNQDIHFLELIKGAVGAFFFRLVGMILGYLFLFMVASEFGAEGTGVFALILTFISIGALLAKAGVDVITMRNIAKLDINLSRDYVKGHYIQGLLIVIFISSLISLIFSFFSEVVASEFLNKPVLNNALFWAAFIVPVVALTQFHAEVLRAVKLVSYYSFLMSTSVYLFAIIFLFSAFSTNLTNYLFIDYFLFANIATLAIGVLIWFRVSQLYKVKATHKESYGSLVKTSLPVMVTGSIFLVMGWADIVMLGVYASEADVGIYNIALKLAAVTTISLMAINSIVAPKVSKFYSEKQFEEMEKFIHQATRMIFISAFPVLMIFILFSKDVLSVFGHEFVVGATTLIILTLGQFINAISGPVGQILNMTDLQKVLRDTGILAATVNIVLNYFLIPIYGIEGAAVATVISGVLWNLMCVAYIYKRFNILVLYIPGLKYAKNLLAHK